MSFCESFNFEVEKIVDVIRSRDLKRIYIQLPEGLQQCAKFIVDRIRMLLDGNVEIFISANPSYGSCLVDEYGARAVDAQLIVHFGHTPYPHHKYSVDVLFIPVEYVEVDRSRILEAVKSLCHRDGDKLCLATTPQHISLARSVCSAIEECGCVFRGIIMGCLPVSSEDCSMLVVIGGGRFHCIAQALSEYRRNSTTISPKILCLDPYSYSLWDPSREVEKIVRIRMWKVFQAINSKRWLIVDGFYGQSREDLLAQLTGLLRAGGKEYYVVKVLKLDREVLANIDVGNNFDAIVVASCPYLAFDFSDFEKPILTIGEALMILSGDISRYVYPW